MGAETFLSEHPFADEQPNSPGGLSKRAVDLPLLVAVIALVIFGLIMMFSASWDYSLTEYGSPMYMFEHQLLWLAIGIVAAFVLSRFDYHHWRKLVVPALGLTILLLIAVLLANEILLGARRYLFQGSFQPSELAKVVTILYLSVWLYAKRQFIHDVTFGLIPLSLILGVVGGLIYQQPDLSTAAIVLLLGGLLFFLAGGDMKQIAILLVIAIAVGWAVVRINPTGHERVAAFIAGLEDPTQASYHVQRSFEAIVNGGWLGVGIGRGQSKLTGLPVPPTDSIFAVIVEELGVAGATFLVVLYAVLIWRGLVIARRAPDMLGTLIASGLVISIGIQAAINMSVMVGLIPFSGDALPFISAGGSNLISSLASIGILMNISRQKGERTTSDLEEWRTYRAALDLRGWNRRRRIPRPRRSPRSRNRQT
ncbi:MAG TPA: putative peptidoglycan glycosyltransferase FtsW [Anaerolineales bacterium]|nr:putative peptidoglycan glycosyltransferase FtsW [Anaerolineales bacterium]